MWTSAARANGSWATRGGSADHAAIKHGREQEVVSVSFFPFRILAHHPFPAGCNLIVCHSGQFRAQDRETPRERFKRPGVVLSHGAGADQNRASPPLAPRIQHLRDVNSGQSGGVAFRRSTAF